MAVIAFRRLGVTQLRDFSVVRVKIRFGDLFVTSAALRHDIELESFDIGSPNRMSGVTIVAHGKLFVRFTLQRGVDALHKLLLDPMVAFTAGCGDVLRIDA